MAQNRGDLKSTAQQSKSFRHGRSSVIAGEADSRKENRQRKEKREKSAYIEILIAALALDALHAGLGNNLVAAKAHANGAFVIQIRENGRVRGASGAAHIAAQTTVMS